MFRRCINAIVLMVLVALIGGCGPTATPTPVPPTREPTEEPLATAAPTVESSDATWLKIYRKAPYDFGMGILPAQDSGYFIVGVTGFQEEPDSQGDVYLIRTDAAGEILWEKTYGGPEYDLGHAIIQASDGMLVIAGGTKSFGAGEIDMYLIKIDRDGNEIWAKTFGGPQDEQAVAVYQTPDGGYILIGYTQIAGSEGDVMSEGNIGAGESNIYLVKTDAEGNEIWSHAYTGEDGAPVYTTSGLPTPDGGCLVLARINPNADHDIFLLKVDAGGRQVWSRAWNVEGKRAGNEIIPTSDGNYLIVGIYERSDSESCALLVKVDPEGNEVWAKTVAENQWGYATTVTVAPEGGFVVTGFTGQGSKPGVRIFKVDAGGQLIWTQDFGRRGLLHAYAILPHPEDGYILTGETLGPEDISDVFLLRIDADGNLR